MSIQDIIDELKAEMLDLNEQVQVIQAKADSEKRDLLEDESREIDRLFAKFEQCEDEIARRERIAKQTAKLAESAGIQSRPQNPEPQNRSLGENRQRSPRIEFIEDKGKHGFKSFGEFAMSVVSASGAKRGGGSIDPRLIANAPTTFGSESVGADGGFAVPPDFRAAIVEKVMGEDSLIGRTDQMTTSSNSLTFPKDETTAWQTSGGVLVYWEGENDQLTQSKPNLKSETIKLNKLSALVPITEELMDDAPALDAYLRRKVPQKMDFAINNAIVNGTGAGKPLGILNANCLVSVAKESGQVADSIVFANIVNMWSRMYGPSRSNAVWLVNQDIEPQLMQMSFEGTSSSVPAYMPANGLSASPYGTLMGRPVISTQACKTLGDKGDIILADMSQYMTAIKTGGIRADVSMHLWFDYDTLAFRFIFRVGGQPWWSSSISPLNGSNTLSCFVTLDERS